MLSLALAATSKMFVDSVSLFDVVDVVVVDDAFVNRQSVER